MLHDYAGALHIHSRYSDGSGDIPIIIKHAQRAKLDFMVMADHNNIDGRARGCEGWSGGVLCVFGNEITAMGGHLFTLDYFGRHEDGDYEVRFFSQPLIDSMLERDAFVAVAHPFNKMVPWTDWSVTGTHGFEVFNLDSVWRTAPLKTMLGALAWVPVSPSRAVARFNVIQRPNLEVFDRACAERKQVALGALDVHGVSKLTKKWKVNRPSYYETFRQFRTHVLLPEPLARTPESGPEDRDAVVRALRHGRCYVSNDWLGVPSGFRFYAVTPDGRRLYMGDEAGFEPGTRLRFSVQNPGRKLITLVRDGRAVLEFDSGGFELELMEPGVYRVEVERCLTRIGARWVGLKGWIVSNPIFLRPAPAR